MPFGNVITILSCYRYGLIALHLKPKRSAIGHQRQAQMYAIIISHNTDVRIMAFPSALIICAYETPQ